MRFKPAYFELLVLSPNLYATTGPAILTTNCDADKQIQQMVSTQNATELKIID